METALIPPDLQERFEEISYRMKLGLDTETAFKGNRKTKKRSNRLSSIGSRCVRYLALEYEHWEEIADFEVGTLMNFERGDCTEEFFVQKLRRAFPGKIRELQTDLHLPENITGHIDFAILESALADDSTPYDSGEWKDRLIVMDIKATNLFSGLKNIGDVLNNPWSRQWAVQLNGYIKAAMEKWGSPDYGFLFVVEPTSFDHRLIPMVYSEWLWNWTQDRAKEINAHLEGGPLPPYLNDPIHCQRCRLFEICCPDLKFEDCLSFYKDEGLDSDLATEADWKEFHSAFEKLYKGNRDRLKALHDRNPDVDSFMIGDRFVEVKTNKKGARSFKF